MYTKILVSFLFAISSTAIANNETTAENETTANIETTTPPFIMPTIVVDDIPGPANTFEREEPRPNKFLDEYYKSDTFVDKTYLLKDILTGITADPYLIKCPPRFGKTTNLQMFKAFLEVQWDSDDRPITNITANPHYELFMNLSVGKYEHIMKRHFGQYHVMYLDMSPSPGKTYQNHTTRIYDAVRECISEHRWIMQRFASNRSALDDFYDNMVQKYFQILNQVASGESIGMGLRLTANLLKKFYEKPVILLVDEFESPLVDAITSGVKDEEINNIELRLKSLYGLTFKISPIAIKSALFTSISSIIINRISFNYFSIYRFLGDHPLTKFCGFDQLEVDRLLNVNNIRGLKRTKMRMYYHGYFVMRKNISVYNPFAVRKAIENEGALLDHDNATPLWVEQVPLGPIPNYLKHAEIHVLIKTLISQPGTRLNYVVPIPYTVSEFVNFIRNAENYTGSPNQTLQPDQFFTHLYEIGYLAYHIKSRLFCVPNLEVKNELRKLTEKIPPYSAGNGSTIGN